jgi:hypothetical protein
MHKEAVGPRRAGHRRIPMVADRELFSQFVQRRQVAFAKIIHDPLAFVGRGGRILLFVFRYESRVAATKLIQDVLKFVFRVGIDDGIV